MSYFAYRLRTEPENPDYLEAEEFYYECKYEIKKYKEQLPLCIISPGRNLVTPSNMTYARGDKIDYKNFLSSISRQKYTNYKLIIVDDSSTDNSGDVIKEYIEKSHPRLK